MSVSSKFGLKIGDHEVFEIKSPDDAIELVRTVVNQFLGESFTTYQPKCPICDSKLSDYEKHMNKPIGECTNDKCDATVHAADYFGKILDVLEEWEKCKPEYEEKMKRLLENQKEEKSTSRFVPAKRSGLGIESDDDYVDEINGIPVFIW